jgi:hypothetical protein
MSLATGLVCALLLTRKLMLTPIPMMRPAVKKNAPRLFTVKELKI